MINTLFLWHIEVNGIKNHVKYANSIFWQSLLYFALLLSISGPILGLCLCVYCLQGPKFARVGTSDYTGIRTSHVFRPGIEPGSTAWKSRALTTQPATHLTLFTDFGTHCSALRCLIMAAVWDQCIDAFKSALSKTHSNLWTILCILVNAACSRVSLRFWFRFRQKVEPYIHFIFRIIGWVYFN